jgi:hypothetical protein
MTYVNDFTSHARQLRSKGKQLGQLHALGKSGGLAVSLLAGLGLVTSGGALVPLMVGLSSYVGSVLSEYGRTGKLKPLPLDIDLATIAHRSLHKTPQPTLATQAHHYLSPEDKALFYLTNYQGHRLTALAQTLSPENFEHIVTNLVDHLITAYPAALNHPELIGQAEGISFIEDAIAALPPAVASDIPEAPTYPRAAIGSQTRLSAVDVMAEPVSDVEDMREVLWDAREDTETVEPLGDIAETVASPDIQGNYRSWLVCGRPGAGKGSLVALASQHVIAQGGSVFLIDPKADPAEAHLWAHIPESQRLHIKLRDPRLDLEAAENDILDLIADFENSRARPCVLICDELPLIASKMPKFSKRLMGDLASVASTGRSQKKAAWCLTQAVGLGDNGMTMGSKASFSELYLADAEGLTALTRHPSFLLETYCPSKLIKDGKRVYLSSIDNRWLPLPRYDLQANKSSTSPGPIQDPQANKSPITPEALQALRSHGENKGWLSATQVKQSGPRSLRHLSVDDIRAMFLALADQGHGVTKGEGQNLHWCLNPET